MNQRDVEAYQLWRWIQWRLPADLWMQAQQALTEQDPPPLTDPQLISGLAQLQDPQVSNAVKLNLLRQLLIIVRDSGLLQLPSP